MNFKSLHYTEDPLLICNVWDVVSAKIAENLNFHAIGTSSGAIATMLGYKDGEEIPFPELKYIINRITNKVNLPLSVDLESGYGSNVEEITGNILELAKLGIVGINIEDSKVKNGQRSLINSAEFSILLNNVLSRLKTEGCDIFVNVRIDTYLMGLDNSLEETIRRAKLYQKTGANGVFVPCIVKEADIEQVVKTVELPLNVMCMPNLPNFQILKGLGVKRISMGNFVFNKLNDALKTTLDEIKSKHCFTSLF